MTRYDIAIVGAGIAGASLAAELAPLARVLLLEMEDQPGYHSTGRSAAFWSETYGGPFVQPLTTASGPLLAPWLAPLGSLHIARSDDDGIILNRFDPRGTIHKHVKDVSVDSVRHALDVGRLRLAFHHAARIPEHIEQLA